MFEGGGQGALGQNILSAGSGYLKEFKFLVKISKYNFEIFGQKIRQIEVRSVLLESKQTFTSFSYFVGI